MFYIMYMLYIHDYNYTCTMYIYMLHLMYSLTFITAIHVRVHMYVQHTLVHDVSMQAHGLHMALHVFYRHKAIDIWLYMHSTWLYMRSTWLYMRSTGIRLHLQTDMYSLCPHMNLKPYIIHAHVPSCTLNS